MLEHLRYRGMTPEARERLGAEVRGKINVVEAKNISCKSEVDC